MRPTCRSFSPGRFPRLPKNCLARPHQKTHHCGRGFVSRWLELCWILCAAELDTFNKAVSDRFGERTFLGNAARDASGPGFENAAQGMSPGEREKLKSAWPTMRAGQQVVAHERTQQALKQSEAMRQTQTKSQGLKQ